VVWNSWQGHCAAVITERVGSLGQDLWVRSQVKSLGPVLSLVWSTGHITRHKLIAAAKDHETQLSAASICHTAVRQHC